MSELLTSFRERLELDCKIARWTPTDGNLLEIARHIASATEKTSSTVRSAIFSVCPQTLFRAEEGLDNSDLRTLLALATSVAAKG